MATYLDGVFWCFSRWAAEGPCHKAVLSLASRRRPRLDGRGRLQGGLE